MPQTSSCRGRINNSTVHDPQERQPRPERLQRVVDLYKAGQLDAALTGARALTESFPRHPFGWKAFGALLRERGKIRDAVQALRIAADLAGDAESHNNLGLALQESGDREQAESSFRQALRLNDRLVEAHSNLGRLYLVTGRLADAEACLRRALALAPNLAEVHANLAAVLLHGVRLREAEASCRRALQIRPDFSLAHTDLGVILNSAGRLAEAEACFRQALALRPDDLVPLSNLLFNLCYAARLAPQVCLEEAREYGRRAAAVRRQRFVEWPQALGARRLRIGLVSGDLRQHPVGYFLAGVLAQLARSDVEILAYPTMPGEDELTKSIRSSCMAWRPLYGLLDADAARMIHADGIQVLIDLAGHTAHNRLPVFAWKPAPVQVSWLGYFATTGVAEIDYLLADAVSVPPEHHRHFTEAIRYLPDTRLCFTPPDEAVPVAPLPALTNGFVTFGSFQNLAKLHDEVLALWARVLGAVPGSRLRLQNRQLADLDVRAQLLQRLQRAGVAAERVMLHDPQTRGAYLGAHAEVDLILDTFPFPGGTTTCEALWMGVPTLTLAGDRLIGRQGASLLAAAGLGDWIAADPYEFVAKAVERAGNLAELAALRSRLREQLLASPLTDAPRFARNLERALRDMWQSWRRAQP